MSSPSNLTRDEAAIRAALVGTPSYVVELDLTRGERHFGCRAVVRFGCREPGSATFIDLSAPAVTAMTLNGRPLDPDAFDGHRIRLDGLAADNELRVEAECAYENTGVGMHRFVDPVDGEVYLYTQFEPFDAHRVFPCFDQPDVKGTFALQVHAPEGWEVVSNGMLEGRPGPGASGPWRFAPTPPVSTYVTAVVAGPYHAVRGHHDGVDLGLFCRRSLSRYLDPPELLEVTAQGFDYFQRVFGYRYPFVKYDQCFVPEFNAGAMENAACVTVSEHHLFRAKVTDAARQRRAETVLHELAHMWFGDLVTMKWWDDLWLNESFATFMAYLAAAEATRFTTAFTSFTNGWKTWAYRQDQLPSTHPIMADIVDVDAVHTNFDGITYAKGASVLRQLVAWVGQDRFLSGVAAYFRRHQWGNTTLSDFLTSLEEASGRDLGAWSKEWLETAGVNTLRPALEVAGDRLSQVRLLQEAPEAWPTLRSHRVAVGLYDHAGGRLSLRRRVEIDAVGASTDVPELAGEPVPDLLLVNDGDLAYAKIRLDPRSLGTLTDHLGQLDDGLARALCWAAAWDMLRDGELPARRYLPLVLNNVGGEDEISVMEILLTQALMAAVVYGDPANRSAARQQLADATHTALHRAEPGSDEQLAWAHAFISAARSPVHLGALRRLLDGSLTVAGLTIDVDLRWHIVRALAEAGAADEEVIAGEAERDPTDAGLRHAAAARAARPDPAAKAAAWDALTDDPDLPLATMGALMSGFMKPDQEELVAPYMEPYFAALDRVWQERGHEVALAFAERLYPAPLASDELVARTEGWLATSDAVPPLRRLVVEGLDGVQRVRRARAADAAAGAS